MSKGTMRIGNRRRFAVPAVRRILVGVHGSPGSLQALRYAADEARARDVPLVPVIAWIPPGGDLDVRAQALRGVAGPVLVAAASAPEDLLITGTGGRAVIGRVRGRTTGRYCLAHAGCPVLAVPPSALTDELGHGLRSWHLRRQARAFSDVASGE
jgi:nucleotide-binding universal stress UspA family protein